MRARKGRASSGTTRGCGVATRGASAGSIPESESQRFGYAASMMFWFCVALSVIAGVGTALQGPANAAVARTWDLSRSIALNGAVVFVGSAIGMLFFRSELPPETTRPPWIQMIGGLCGLGFISVAAFSVPRIGASVFTAALVLGMVAASLCIDHFGWFGQVLAPITPVRLIGVTLIVVGVALVRLTATQS